MGPGSPEGTEIPTARDLGPSCDEELGTRLGTSVELGRGGQQQLILRGVREPPGVVLSVPGTPSSLGQGAHWPPTPSLGFPIWNSSAPLAPPGRAISFSEDLPCVPTVPPAAHDPGPSTPHFQRRKLE